MFELVTDNSLPCLIRLPSQLSPVTRWVERCSQCTLVIFSLVSSGNMAKQFESSLLDEFCNQKLPSSQANFRITDMSCIRDAENVPYALLVERIQTSLVMPLSGSRHRHHTWSQGWCIHSAILSCWQRYTGFPEIMIKDFHATTCKLYPSLDILVISTSWVDTQHSK